MVGCRACHLREVGEGGDEEARKDAVVDSGQTRLREHGIGVQVAGHATITRLFPQSMLCRADFGLDAIYCGDL